MIRLWLDDVRDPKHHGHDGESWRWCTTAEEAIHLLESGTVTFASLDHDLGLVSCKACRLKTTSAEEYEVVSSLGCEHGEKTGYDVVCWLEQHPEFWPKDGCVVHSMNPPGRARMQQVIDKHYLVRSSSLR